MIPKLFDQSSTTFSGIGLGGLSEASDCRVHWQANGLYELEMDYPVTGYRYAQLASRQIILSSAGPDETEQPFRIYRITKPLDGVCRIYARHVAYDLMGFVVRPFEVESLDAAIAAISSGAVVMPHGFTISTDKASTVACTVNAPRSVWSMLGGQEGSLLDVYGGEWDFNRFSATLRSQLGADLGASVRYGVNLRTLEQDENLANCWTAVYPYWQSPQDGALITLPEELIYTGTFDYTRILVLDLSAEFESAPAEAQLRSRTMQYISSNRVGKPSVGLDIDFEPLDQTEEYRDMAFLARIHKGDTVTVEFPTAYNPETGLPIEFVQTQARAVQYTWLPLKDRYESIRLGEKRANFISTMATVQNNTEWLMTKVR